MRTPPSRRILCENDRGPTFPTRRTVEVRCCGSWLSCDAFTVTCDRCGADYNQSGDQLALRSQWGEETGEHWSDIY